jgi:hypothetical protein
MEPSEKDKNHVVSQDRNTKPKLQEIMPEPTSRYLVGLGIGRVNHVR